MRLGGRSSLFIGMEQKKFALRSDLEGIAHISSTLYGTL